MNEIYNKQRQQQQQQQSQLSAARYQQQQQGVGIGKKEGGGGYESKSRGSRAGRIDKAKVFTICLVRCSLLATLLAPRCSNSNSCHSYWGSVSSNCLSVCLSVRLSDLEKLVTLQPCCHHLAEVACSPGSKLELQRRSC